MGSWLQQVGVVYTTAGNAGFITSLYVVLVPVLLFSFWREKVHWIAIACGGHGRGGAFFLSTGGRFEIRQGDVLELVGALFWTFHVIVLGKYASRFEALIFFGWAARGRVACFSLVMGFFARTGYGDQQQSFPGDRLHCLLFPWAVLYPPDLGTETHTACRCRLDP